MIVATDNLSKEYDGVYRVQELDIRIKEGDIYGFLGPNGAGKSTTMKMLLGLVKPTSGKVFLTFVLILGVELLFVFSNYGNNENFLGMISDPNAPAWEDLIVGPATMNGLFLPILAAVIASRICDMEHRGNTWKLLQKTKKGWWAKWQEKAENRRQLPCRHHLCMYMWLCISVFLWRITKSGAAQ